jgi:hypothetical protein
MKKRLAGLCAAVLAGALQSSGAAGGEVAVYQPAQLKQSEYETVARVWVETWRARFWAPTYGTREDGVAALRDKAAALGANGLINVSCYADRGPFSLGSESFLCYGKAIKVR